MALRNPAELGAWRERLDAYLQQPPDAQEAHLETLIPPLAEWVARTLRRRAV